MSSHAPGTGITCSDAVERTAQLHEGVMLLVHLLTDRLVEGTAR
jgi:hypothetical protein